LLGYSGQISWKQNSDALIVTLPGPKISDYTVGLKITGLNLKAVPIPEVVEIAKPSSDGAYYLTADAATLHGSQINTETRGNVTNIGYWDRSSEFVTWKGKFFTPGSVYHVTVDIATVADASQLVVEFNGHPMRTVIAPNTGGWDRFQTVDVGMLEVAYAGVYEIKVRAADAASWKPINLREVTLTPGK
jgi:hypothetical protein